MSYSNTAILALFVHCIINNDVIRNGQDRAHRIYNTTNETCAYFAKPNEEISYSFNSTEISSVHLVFDSDLNRDTLPGGQCERIHSMRAQQLIESPQMYMPKTLCREFMLYGELNGEKTEILHISDNRKRSYHIDINKTFDKLVLVPVSKWDEEGNIAVVSFDFE